MKKASDNLVRAAQKAAFDKSDEDNVVVKTKFVGGIAQVKLHIYYNKPVYCEFVSLLIIHFTHF